MYNGFGYPVLQSPFKKYVALYSCKANLELGVNRLLEMRPLCLANLVSLRGLLGRNSQATFFFVALQTQTHKRADCWHAMRQGCSWHFPTRHAQPAQLLRCAPDTDGSLGSLGGRAPQGPTRCVWWAEGSTERNASAE